MGRGCCAACGREGISSDLTAKSLHFDAVLALQQIAPEAPAESRPQGSNTFKVTPTLAHSRMLDIVLRYQERIVASVCSRAAKLRQQQGNVQTTAETPSTPRDTAGCAGSDTSSQGYSKGNAVLTSGKAQECTVVETAQSPASDSSTRDKQGRVTAPAGALVLAEDEVDTRALAATRSALAAMGLLGILQVCSLASMLHGCGTPTAC